MYHDESGVSVIIGTLMLILITITAASGLALMVSGMQKEAMERESHIAAVESENLRIIAIDPIENSTYPAQWDSVNVTLMNLNTADSRVTAISLNGVHARNYLAKGASGDLDYYKGYPAVYNFKKRVVIPAAGSKEICLNFSGIVINTKEVIDVSGWTDNSNNSTPIRLSNHPRVAYPDVNYSENVSNSTMHFSNITDYDMNKTTGSIILLGDGDMSSHFNFPEIIDVTGWYNNSINYTFPLTHPHIKDDSEKVSNSTMYFSNTTDYTMDYTAGDITLIGTAFGGNMSNNTGNYNINYTTYNTSYNINYTTRFDAFTPPPHVYCDEPLTIEVITSLINIFKRTFVPPVPLAEVQVRSEWISSNKTRDYLILDASESFDPDGYIVGYGWSIYYDCDPWWWEYVNNETFNCADCNTPRNLSCRNDSNFDRIVNSDLTVSNETMVFGTDLDNANYTIDAPNGTITCNCSGNMSNDTEYNITYCYNCNATEGAVHHLTGMKVRVNTANLHPEHCDECGPFYIDLDVIDDTGMIANLAWQSGEIYIPRNENFNNS